MQPTTASRTLRFCKSRGSNIREEEHVMCPEPRLYDETESKSAAGTNVSGEAASETTASGLLDRARSALAHNPLLPADKIRVVVRNAWLILEGEVQAHVQRQAAEDAVKDL